MATWRPGLLIEDWLVESWLGRGAFGDVWKVRHRHTNDNLAVKVVQPTADPARAEQAVRIARHEAATAPRTRHVNIARILDAREIDGAICIVYEYVHGVTLREWLRARERMVAGAAAEFVIQTLHGIAHCHEKGLLHRDIAAKNLMLGVENDAIVTKIIDLGLAKVLGDSATSSIAPHGGRVGTPMYMAPEQLRRDVPDPRADVYSIGIVLYEALTGLRPFPDDDPLSRLRQAPRSLPADLNLPHGLEPIVMRALEQHRAKRYSSAREFADALTRFRDINALNVLAPEVRRLADERDTARVRLIGPNDPTPPVERSLHDVIDDHAATPVHPGRPVPAARPSDAPMGGIEATAARPHAYVATTWRRRIAWSVMALLVVGMIATAILFRPQSKTPETAEGSSTAASPPIAAKGRLIIDAHPWAEILSVRTADGTALSIDDATPVNVPANAGRYVVTLRGPDGQVRVEETIVRADALGRVRVSFRLPSRDAYLKAARLSR